MKKTMLRITRLSNNGSPVTLKLEGKVHDEWVSLLEQECKAVSEEHGELVLDFAEVTYVDDSGIDLIRRFPAQNIKIINGDTFIADLKDRGGERWNK